MIVLPIRTDRRLQRMPWVNYALIAANVIIYLITADYLDTRGVRAYFLFPLSPHFKQFLSYQFLHADGWHLLSNMVFLFVFGNSVEDRLGRVSYMLFYLAGGIFAGLGECFVVQPPIPGVPAATVLGASGAVAGVTGAYLALFPRTRITLFLFIGVWEVSSLLLILFNIGLNVYMHLSGGEGVAYVAHLAGYLYGFVVAFLLLRAGLLVREPHDLLAVFEHRQRAAKFSSMTREGYNPWQHQDPYKQPASARQPTTTQVQMDPQCREMRQRIAELVDQRDLTQAAQTYARLIERWPDQVMPRQAQLDLANQLASDDRKAAAAHAYELFLEKYKNDSDRDQVSLILSLLYVRYLDRKQRARELMTELDRRLTDPGHRALLEQLREELPPAQ